jgi:glutathione synthase/RimK-type ligase-like ATP-grasp enzyme
LARLGVQVDLLDWDDSTVDWAGYDRVVLRSAWDYAERLDEFLGWVEAVDAVTDLRNPRPMLGWSVDKHYLLDLAAAGVAIVPTTAVEVGDEPAVPDGALVVKPAVGAGSRDVASYAPGDVGLVRAHVRRLHDQGRAVLVQPRLASVAELGEWPMVYFGGEYSHAASKRVRVPHGGGSVEGLFAAEENAPYVPDPDQRAVADAAIEHVNERFGVPTYARVDLVRDDDGRPCVLELELVEPSLFLLQADGGASERLAHALTS